MAKGKRAKAPPAAPANGVRVEPQSREATAAAPLTTTHSLPQSHRKQLEAEKRAREAAERRATEAVTAVSSTGGRRAASSSHVLMPKPKGSVGQGICLIEAMGLENNVEQYNAILRDVRDLIHSAKLDWTVDYREQPMEDLGNLFSVARQRNPILANFKNDWVTSEIVKQFMRNRRKHAYRIGALQPTTKHNRDRIRPSGSHGDRTDTSSGPSNRRRVIGQVDPADDTREVAPSGQTPRARPRPRKKRRVQSAEGLGKETGEEEDSDE